MTEVLIDLRAIFYGLTCIAATLLMLTMLVENQRPQGAARCVWKAAWALLYITSGLTLCLFAVWVAERVA